MKPDHGARFTLRLEKSQPEVSYQFEVDFGEQLVRGVASVSLEQGAVNLEADQELPAWLSTTMTGLLRSLWRARTGSASAEPWPRRLTRWRQAQGASVS